MLLHNELAAQRNHKEYAKPSTDEGEHEDTGVLEIKAQENESWKGEDDAGGNRLAGVASRLDDVVFKDRGATERAKNADGQDSDRNGSGHGESGAKSYIDGDSAKDEAEERAEEQCAKSELRAVLIRGDEGLEIGHASLRVITGKVVRNP
jgi:hypothetical protein